tara:strand:+ start:2078 stop:2302 length:225 start_codon:yes stop_codon:yes gene_type:complete
MKSYGTIIVKGWIVVLQDNRPINYCAHSGVEGEAEEYLVPCPIFMALVDKYGEHCDITEIISVHVDITLHMAGL